MKINLKLGIFTAAVIILVVVMVSYGVFLYERRTRIDEINQEQRSILQSFITLSEEALIVHDEVLLLNTMQAIENTYRGVEFINFYNLNTERLLFTDREEIDKVYNVIDIHDTWQDGYEFSAPVYILGERTGIAQIGFSQGYYENRIEESIRKARNNIMLISLGALLLGIVLALVVSGTITKPIRKLTEGARYIGEGKLSTRIEINSSDEIGVLADEFNDMALRLLELDKAKDDFVNAVSHELRTPLAAIEGYIDLLLDRGDAVPEEKKKKALKIMKSSSQRLSRFISDILDMAKIKAGMMDIDKKPCALKDIVDKTVSLLDSVAQNKGVRIIVDISSEVPPVFADPERINQVLTNLIGNALKFTPKDGTITVAAENSESGYIKAWVRDTGPGIPQEDLTRIFRQFEQSGDARNVDGPKGTGLGLAIAQGIVNSHGGKIWVESKRGEGAAFFFTLPVARNLREST